LHFTDKPEERRDRRRWMLAKEELEGNRRRAKRGIRRTTGKKEARSLFDVPVTSIWKA
jgi:hypothetical protein